MEELKKGCTKCTPTRPYRPPSSKSPSCCGSVGGRSFCAPLCAPICAVLSVFSASSASQAIGYMLGVSPPQSPISVRNKGKVERKPAVGWALFLPSAAKQAAFVFFAADFNPR